MNTTVSSPLAKLLKEKGFDEPCKLCVEDGDERPLPFNCGNTIHRNSLHPYYSAPTIAEVVMWLYEKYDIWICVDKAEGFNWFKFNIRKLKDIGYEYGGFGSDFNSPKEAQVAAIEYTLNNLI